PQERVAGRLADGRDNPRTLERKLNDKRRWDAEGTRAVRRLARALEGALEKESVRHQAGVHCDEDHERAASRNHPGAPLEGARGDPGGRMTPASVTAPKQPRTK